MDDSDKKKFIEYLEELQKAEKKVTEAPPVSKPKSEIKFIPADMSQLETKPPKKMSEAERKVLYERLKKIIDSFPAIPKKNLAVVPLLGLPFSYKEARERGLSLPQSIGYAGLEQLNKTPISIMDYYDMLSDMPQTIKYATTSEEEAVKKAEEKAMQDYYMNKKKMQKKMGQLESEEAAPESIVDKRIMGKPIKPLTKKQEDEKLKKMISPMVEELSGKPAINPDQSEELMGEKSSEDVASPVSEDNSVILNINDEDRRMRKKLGYY